MSRFLLALLFLPSLAFADGRYLVEFRGTPAKAQFERFRRDATAALGKRGMEVTPRHELSRVFHGVAVTLDEASAEAVGRLPYVAAVYPDREVQAFDTDVNHLERIGAKQVWTSFGAQGAGVTIAIIDSGVDRTHPAFAGRYAGGWDFVDKDNEPEDPLGHGTHVAGTALGEGFGVAPKAKLLAYRVLDAYGSGLASDVMAAMERALEDGADVINLSLGTISGTSDDPEARAVDEAVEAGIVVVLGAGNLGGTQSIGSPATSRLGIVVGNADASDALVGYSSYGPVHPGLDLKPDLVAPGEEILSARTGGGTRVLSGTSMASPHVAGAAALLLELQRDWTPEQVKAALIATAQPTADEVMKRGAGRVDVHRAAMATALASPASLSFGRMKGTDAEWTATRVVRITASAAQTFQAQTEPQPGIRFTIEPAAFTLAAGESRDVTITVHAQDLPPVSPATLAFGGAIAFTESLRIPWVFVHAAAIQVGPPEPNAFVMWSCGPDFATNAPNTTVNGTTLLPPRDCTSIVRFDGLGTMPPAVILEPRTILADEALSFGRERARYRVVPGGVDEQGRPLQAQGEYASLYRIDFGPSRFPKFVDFDRAPLLSAMPDDVTITASEMVADLANGRVVGVQHAPIRGMRGDHTFVNATTDFTKGRVRVLPSAGELGAALSYLDGWGVPAMQRLPLANGWEGDVFVIPSKTPGDPAAPVLATPSYVSAPLGGDAVLGEKPLFPRVELLTRMSRFGISTQLLGPMLERHYAAPLYEARDASGALVQQGYVEPFTIVEHAGPGAYTLTLRTHGAGVTTYAFDTRRADPIPPSLTSARVTGNDVVFTASEPVTSRVSHIGGQIRLEIVDTAGNSCTWTVPPDGGLEKRRAARH